MNLRVASLVLSFFPLAAACHTIHPVGAPGNRVFMSGTRGEVSWPVQYRPQFTTLHVQNEIEIGASPQAVWDALVQDDGWPASYEGDVSAPSFELVAAEFEPPWRLGWESRTTLTQSYQAWLIVAMRDGCRLVVAETGYGFPAVLDGVFFQGARREQQGEWLTEIKRRAESAGDGEGTPGGDDSAGA